MSTRFPAAASSKEARENVGSRPGLASLAVAGRRPFLLPHSTRQPGARHGSFLVGPGTGRPPPQSYIHSYVRACKRDAVGAWRRLAAASRILRRAQSCAARPRALVDTGRLLSRHGGTPYAYALSACEAQVRRQLLAGPPAPEALFADLHRGAPAGRRQGEEEILPPPCTVSARLSVGILTWVEGCINS
jgi:hypothetical protein